MNEEIFDPKHNPDAPPLDCLESAVMRYAFDKAYGKSYAELANVHITFDFIWESEYENDDGQTEIEYSYDQEYSFSGTFGQWLIHTSFAMYPFISALTGWEMYADGKWEYHDHERWQ